MSDEKVWRGLTQKLSSELRLCALPLWVNYPVELALLPATDYDALLRELTTAREQIAELERERANMRPRFEAYDTARREGIEAIAERDDARTALAEATRERDKYKPLAIDFGQQLDESGKRIVELKAENTRLRAEMCNRKWSPEER